MNFQAEKYVRTLIFIYLCTCTCIYIFCTSLIPWTVLWCFYSNCVCAELQDTCAAETSGNNKLATICRMVEFIGRYEESRTVVSLVSSAQHSLICSQQSMYLVFSPKPQP